MCRIAGFWDFNYRGDYHIEEVAIAMRDTLSHGGPDDAGIFLEKSKGLALTHRRLSILDLSPTGHQPMEFDNLVIVYNGEVYNFREIRQELEKEGYSFKSTSDTEVVLKAFHRWGLDAVHKFIGMFAFAIWDKKEKMLILCRDRIGVKPLYWYYDNGLFMFSSELKAFHKHPKFRKELNIRALSLYLQYGYITAPYSIFENTYKLRPGHFLIIKESGEIEEIQYWDVKEFYIRGVKEAEKWKKRKEEEIAEELEDILKNSFKLRLVSDVPVGIFLSGGIDSTTVTALLQKETTTPLRTFTIGFYEKNTMKLIMQRK
ncbi:MAG: asparagine synthase (glutamine-hydrolyzing) [Aquificaceae bacterium]|nr:asparagine synthase (glutamine-hydrolyzing) [Aquificaceae bacterium]